LKQTPKYSRPILWLLAGLLVAMTMWFTHQLAETIGQEERRRVEIYAAAIQNITKASIDEQRDYSFEIAIVQNNATIPMIWTDSLFSFIDARNFTDTSKAFLKQKSLELRQENRFITISSPFGPAQFVYYDQSQILTWLQYVPFGQLALVMAFVLFGYLSFSAARKAEQNQIWIGLAKETAHQLGTPISGILGWLEVLKIYEETNPEIGGVVDEIKLDVNRLELVADRFSKIGATPHLEPTNVWENVERGIIYFRQRAPRKVFFECPDIEEMPEQMVAISSSLFDWVIENLLKNALDALETGQGRIVADCFNDPDWVYIDITDTGKGIPANKHLTIFEPGFTTKKRGWGLGLSLARRIVEDYHKGKIFVKQSEIGKGTTFRIQLPRINPEVS
jgi:K+-sensing histidine kinase KdpD